MRNIFHILWLSFVLGAVEAGPKKTKKLKKERCPHIDSEEYLHAISIKLQNIVTG